MTFISYDTPGSGSGGNDEDDTLWGWDDTQLVGVGLSPDEQLREIRIDSEWKSKIDADSLSTAVLTAYFDAVSARISKYPQGGPTIAPDSTREPEPVGVIENPVIEFELVAQVQAEQPEYFASFQGAISAEQTFVSSDHNVTVTAQGGSPVSINFEDSWMRFAEARHIVESTREALVPAIESGRAIAAQMREQFPATAEFNRLMRLKKAARGF